VLEALMEALSDEARSILFSSQNTLDMEQISGRITFMDRGRIIDSGTRKAISIGGAECVSTCRLV
jgi:ABC-2 type transport system ATP-binding protein